MFLLPTCRAIKNSILKQYADDCTVSKEIRNGKDERDLQEDLDSASVWCENNGMELNALKCKVMDITHARSVRHTQYEICGQKLNYVETERLLGVHISKDLKWNHHTEVVRKKAAQILGFAQRNLKGCTPRVKRTAYLTMVKPILFYGTPAWHPETKANTEKIERVQRRALKFIHGSNPPLSTQKKVMPVHMQLRYTDLHFFKKCEAGEIDCDVRERIVEKRALRGGSSSSHPQLQPLPARTLFGERAYAFRVVGPWNNLPDRLKDCTADKFPALCKAHLWQNFSV